MKIVFGLWADGRTFPEHGAHGPASAGEPVLGPAGFLEAIETALGLSGPTVSEVQRVAAWQAKLQSVTGPRFWTKSLEADAWATARRVLQMRDELRAGGWDASAQWSQPRLADLATAEATGQAIPDGLADRLEGLVAEMDARVREAVGAVRLIELRDDLPPGWRRLLDRLESFGVTISQTEPPVGAPTNTALKRAQCWIESGGFSSAGPDQTLVELRADTALAAAEAIAAWCADSSDAEGRRVIIAEGGDSQALDHALALQAQPRGGLSAPSAYRGVLQVLSLAFQLAWAPFDAAALLELLSLPQGPVSRRAAAVLANALEEAPGVGGPVWVDAWAKIEASERAREDDEPKKIEARLAEWRSWVEPIGANPETGLELGRAIAICDRVSAWATRMHGATGESFYFDAQQLAAAVRDAIARLASPTIPRALMDRIIDQALAVGVRNPNAIAEAGSWRTLAHAGALWGEVDVVVWWNFTEPGERPSRSAWFASELEELAAAGVDIDNPAAASRRLARAWEQPVRFARQRVIFVRSSLSGDGEASAHPLAHRLAPALKSEADHVQVESACDAEQWTLGGSEIARRQLEPLEEPAKQPAWRAPETFEKIVDGRKESATSLEDLFACPLRWSLRHVGRIRPGRARSLPDSNQLMGNLAHAMACKIFRPGPPPIPGDAAAAADGIFDRLINEMATPLLAPAAAADLALARSRLPSAMAALARVMEENKLEILETERHVAGTFDDLELTGSIDLVARNSAGRLVVIDLKWTRDPKSRRNELESGGAVQLAVYAALLDGEDPGEGGYFLLSQREFLVPAGGSLRGRELQTPRDLADTWEAVKETWSAHRENVAKNGLVACGLDGSENLMPAVLGVQRDVRCDRCDYTSLCRI